MEMIYDQTSLVQNAIPFISTSTKKFQYFSSVDVSNDLIDFFNEAG